MKKLGVALLVAAGGWTLVAGNTCTWTGGGQDGKWSTAANWDVPPLPGNGDLLVIGDGGASTENDIDNLSVGGLKLVGSVRKMVGGKMITFTGKPILAPNNGGTVDARSYSLHSSWSATISCPLHFAADGGVVMDLPSGTVSMALNGPITIAAGKTLRLGDAYSRYRDSATGSYDIGSITGPDATLQLSFWKKPGTLNGAIDVKNITVDYVSQFTWPAVTGGVTVRGKELKFFYFDSHFRAEDMFGDCLPVLTWGGYYEIGNDNCVFDLDGHSQTIDRMGAGFLESGDKTVDPGTGQAIRSKTNPATLTMKATAAGGTYGVLRGKLSLVYDPVDPSFSFKFLDRVSDMSGTITVKKGTLALKRGAAFTQTTQLTVAADATFDLTESTASAPLPALKVVDLASTAKLKMPAGLALTVEQLIVNGVPLASGVYTGTGGSGTVLGQLVGTGTVTVTDARNYWVAAGDGDWNLAANWTYGVPGTDRVSSLCRNGATTVTIGTTPPVVGDFEMSSRYGTAALAVNAPLTFANGSLMVGTNATVATAERIVFGSKSTAADADAVLTVTDGGRLNLGADLVASNLYGRIVVKDGGVLSITNAQVDAANPANAAFGTVMCIENARLDLAGTAQLIIGYDFGDPDNAHRVGTGSFHAYRGSTVNVGGNAVLNLNSWACGEFFGTGTHTFSDHANLCWHQYIRGSVMGDRAGETATLVFKDHATMNPGPQEFEVGHNTPGALALVRVQDDANVYGAGGGVEIGINNSTGIVEVCDNAQFRGGSSYGLYVGYYSSYAGATDNDHPVGILRVSGGTVYPRGYYSASRNNGLVVGNGGYWAGSGNEGRTVSFYTGYVELSGGLINVTSGETIFGHTVGYGQMTQTGGTFANASVAPAVLGFHGGEGVWEQSGGTATFVQDVYVGGANNKTAPAGSGQWGSWSYTARFGSKGTLAVAGGTFTVAGSLVVGARGAGTVALAETGAITAKSVMFSDVVADATSGTTTSATLKVTPSQTGAGLLTATETLTIGTDAKLVVDLDGYEGRRSQFTFLRAGTIAGTFADVEILGDLASSAHVEQRATELKLYISRGTVLVLR